MRLEEHLHTAEEDMDGTTGAVRIYDSWNNNAEVNLDGLELRPTEYHYNPKWSDDTQDINGPWLIRHMKDNAPEEGWGNREIAIPQSDEFPDAKVTSFRPSTGMAALQAQDGLLIKTPLYAIPCHI